MTCLQSNPSPRRSKHTFITFGPCTYKSIHSCCPTQMHRYKYQPPLTKAYHILRPITCHISYTKTHDTSYNHYHPIYLAHHHWRMVVRGAWLPARRGSAPGPAAHPSTRPRCLSGDIQNTVRVAAYGRWSWPFLLCILHAVFCFAFLFISP